MLATHSTLALPESQGKMERSLGESAMTTQSQLLLVNVLALWVVASALLKAWRRQRAHAASKSPSEIISLSAIGQVIGGVLLAAALYSASGLFLTGPVLARVHLLAGAILLAAVIDGAGAFVWAGDPRERSWIALVSAATTLVCGVALFGFAHHLRSVPGPRAAAIHAEYPVRGRWRVVTGGRTAITNYHHGRPESQNCAVDMVLDGPENASWGEPVFAPVSGVVTTAVGDRREGDVRPADGNVVIIETPDGAEVCLAHLMENSVTVSPGDRVTAGERIAACGATGSADIAHVHIHAQRGDRAVPILFGPEGRFLVRNDVFDGGE
jgi:hypothetical protein